MRLGIVFVFALFASACGTALPPGSFDWGHGAIPLEKGEKRFQFGGGVGGAVGLVKSDIFGPPLQLATSGWPLPVGLGVGGGSSIELQVTDWMSLRAESSLGAEWSLVSGLPSAAGAGYLGTQMNFAPNFAARTRLGLGAAGTSLLYLSTLNAERLFDNPVAHVEGEAGLVYTFPSPPTEERWIYTYGNGRAGNAQMPDTGRFSGFGLFGLGVNLGWSQKMKDDFSFYTSARADYSTSYYENGSTFPLASFAVQVGVTTKGL